MGTEIKGIVKKVIMDHSETWTKATFVVEEETPQYPESVAAVFFNDKIPALVQEGDKVKMVFFLNVREYNGKYYQDARGWKIEKVEAEAAGEESF